MNLQEFPSIFKSLTGNDPFPWQGALFREFVEGRIPACCDLPTGLGKTSVVALWLIALATHPDKVPRRLVYVVNRRTVVDQTTVEVEKLRKNIAAARLENGLKKLCANESDVSLAISTLRGQFADNREWSADPSRPAIIVGTVDMIGSRLLFSAYGASFRTKPLYAGFLGQDVFLVHDEAHLEPAFQALLESIENEQSKSNDTRKIKVMELSATPRGEKPPFRITVNDESNDEIHKRLFAFKKLNLHPLPDGKKIPDQLVDLALGWKDSGRPVIVFARGVEDVEQIAAALEAKKQDVIRLTGTMRGKERNDLVDSPAFQRFLPLAPDEISRAVYLVCTSAGEVGVNISAYHLVCDLSTFESMAQRFGRVNRFGQWNDTQIDVVHPTKFDEEKPVEVKMKKTLELLHQLNGNASPQSLGQLDNVARLDAFSPPPVILPATDILFDAWSLTSIRDKLPGRPNVEPYLHGITDYEPPQTQVAWREEVGVITGELLPYYPPKKLQELLEDYPLKPHELLRDRSDRIFDQLAVLAKRQPELPVWLVSDDGAVTICSLDQVADKKEKERIQNRIVLLPPAAGGLSGGMLKGESEHADDVADEWFDEKKRKRRVRVWDDDPDAKKKTEGMRRVIPPIESPNAENQDEDSQGKLVWSWYERPEEADNEGSTSAPGVVLLQHHTNDVEKNMEHFLTHIDLPDEVKQALCIAARAHDLGKNRKTWQNGIGNFTDEPWAKSGKYTKLSQDYRHEFGSLLDVTQSAEFQDLSEDMKDVVLHLISAHHGRGRPHFSAEEAFDPEGNGKEAEAMALEVPRRFARLQQHYGRWGLAWLESLLRAADYAASAAPSTTVKEAS